MTQRISGLDDVGQGEFEGWCAQRGITADGVQVHDFAGCGRGIRATHDLRAGTSLSASIHVLS